MIQLTNVRKYFGEKRALGPVSFEISSGGAVGFLGLNGAGKTTLLSILATDLRRLRVKSKSEVLVLQLILTKSEKG